MISCTLVETTILLSIAFGSAPVGPAVWYVDDDANGANDGTSWMDAFSELQSALAVAQAGDEIRLAQGIYRPDYDVNTGQHTADRLASFRLVNGVAVSGGYAGLGEPDPDQRDTVQYPTVLSGDLNGDDQPEFVNYDENVHHVVEAQDVDHPNSLLDGVTITGGNANSDSCCFYWRGAGFYLVRSPLTINDCVITANVSENSIAQGGGMYIVTDSNALLTQCRFFGNQASDGGAVYINNSNPTFIDCHFEGNSAAAGGGITSFVSGPLLIDCTFLGHDVPVYGGGMRSVGGSPVLINCLFQENSASQGGGGAKWYQSNVQLQRCRFIGNASPLGAGLEVATINGPSSASIFNCQFTDNIGSAILNHTAVTSFPATSELVNCTLLSNSGGGVSNFGSSLAAVSNSILWNNGGGSESDQINPSTGSITVNYSCIQGWTGALGGRGNIASYPEFVDPVQGDFHLHSDSPCIDAGDNTALPADDFDVDGDGNTTEPNPFDFDANPRRVNDPCTDDTANPAGISLPVDMGAYEYQVTCPGDIDCDGNVGVTDLLLLLAAWGTNPAQPADINGDGQMGILDLLQLLAGWGPCS